MVTRAVHADRDVCIGAGMCVLTTPDLFDQDAEGLVVVRRRYPDAEHDDLADRAVQVCPSGALRRR